MSIRIQPYSEEWIEAVAEFNRRVSLANPPFLVPETPVPLWLPRASEMQNVYQEVFLAVENGCVRGAYTFKHQEFSVGGRIMEVGMCRMPISEGIIDKHYARVGVRLLNDALRRQPFLYGLGLGDLEAVITRMVLAMGWQLTKVIPFAFKVRNGFRFLRNIQCLRSTGPRRLLLDAVAYSGLGWAGAKVGHALLTGNVHYGPVRAEPVNEFSSWADEIWRACKDRYSMIAVRDSKVLNVLYPPQDRRLIRLKVLDGCRVVGWTVLLDTAMSDNQYFGNMRVGSIVDCLAVPEDANRVITSAVKVLEERGVDLLLSNQSHPAWCRALKMAGFAQGPSNFFFVTSKQLTNLLHQVDPAGTGINLNRGDGDGPIHL